MEPIVAVADQVQDRLRNAAHSGALRERFLAVRAQSGRLIEPLAPEDTVIQSMADASPTKWHLAHTTWFFETFVLGQAFPGEPPYEPAFGRLFNSYYNSVGEQFPRPRRGLLSRPTLAEVLDYRRWVDERMADLLSSSGFLKLDALWPVVEIGLHHEQQHQELMLTDIKHVFWTNPLRPAYRPPREADGAAHPAGERVSSPLDWIEFDEGVRWIGHAGDGFAYDNEGPRHRQFVSRFALASRLATNREYLEFIEDGGYRRPELWLSEGWATATQEHWRAPLYWERLGGRWWAFTLAGMRELDLDEPVCHVSYFEADAFALWSGAWLPTEAAWETAAGDGAALGNFVESRRYHPAAVSFRGDLVADETNRRGESPHATEAPGPGGDAAPVAQMFGDVWEWTRSAYDAYPGYRAAEGALGEYNGKFMCNQLVLRGGSCATSRSHIRPTYRNFFPPSARWQFSGIRLCREAP